MLIKSSTRSFYRKFFALVVALSVKLIGNSKDAAVPFLQSDFALTSGFTFSS